MASSSGGDSSSSTSAATPVSLDETDEATAAAIRDTVDGILITFGQLQRKQCSSVKWPYDICSSSSSLQLYFPFNQVPTQLESDATEMGQKVDLFC